MRYIGDRFICQGCGAYFVDGAWVVFGYIAAQEIYAVIELLEGNFDYIGQALDDAKWLGTATDFNYWYDYVVAPLNNPASDAIVNVTSQAYPDTPGETNSPHQIVINGSDSHAGNTGSEYDYLAIKNALLNYFPYWAQLQSSCKLSVSPNSADVSASATSTTFSINTPSGCYWHANVDQPWISLSPNNGNSSTNLTANVSANPLAIARTAHINIKSNYDTQTVSLSQDGACIYTISPTSIYFPSTGGSASISVSTGVGCVWSAVANQSWLSVSPNSGTGNGSFSLNVSSNVDAQSLIGSLTVAGQELNVYIGSASGSPGTGWVTINGSVSSTQQCYTYYGGTQCNTIYNGGGVTVTINGDSQSGGGGDPSVTDADVANQIASGFNSDLGSPVNATVSGSTIYFTAKGYGADSNYPLSVGWTWNESNFSQPSFTATTSGSTLTGGTD